MRSTAWSPRTSPTTSPPSTGSSSAASTRWGGAGTSPGAAQQGVPTTPPPQHRPLPPQLEFVDYVFHGERGRRETANLELLLQRCSEVQHWVGTELLLCESLGRRAHLLKKLIKIAAM